MVVLVVWWWIGDGGSVCGVVDVFVGWAYVKVCTSKRRDYAAIDLARTGTIKHDNPCALGPR